MPTVFWDLTPNELKLCVESANDKVIAERERDVWVAWHTAFLHRVDIKYFPKLTELLDKVRPPVKSDSSKNPDRSTVGRDLMNALLQLPAAPPLPKKVALDASDPSSAPPPAAAATPPPLLPEIPPNG